MSEHTRRNFLKKSVMAGGALALTPVVSSQAAEESAMVISRWKGDSSDIKVIAQKLTEQSINALGGMKRFVKKGQVVWIKPNIGWNREPDKATNTNPDVVETLVRLCLEAGAQKVKVGDFSCEEARKAYPKSGISGAAKRAGAEVVMVDPERFREIDLKGKRMRKWPICTEMLDADVLINAPVAKDHGSTKVTLCMKNLMGMVDKRGKMHQDLSTTIADLTAFVKPQLNVLDAIRILTANGPQGGRLEDVKQLNIVAAGTDIVALDAFGCGLLGHKPTAIETVVAGYERGLGEIDFKKVAKEITVS